MSGKSLCNQFHVIFFHFKVIYFLHLQNPAREFGGSVGPSQAADRPPIALIKTSRWFSGSLGFYFEILLLPCHYPMIPKPIITTIIHMISLHQE